jgi:hypothetical protein
MHYANSYGRFKMETTLQRRARTVVLAAALLAGIPSVYGDALSELASFSVFEKPDLAQLKGEAKAVRGPQMSTPRFLTVQTSWVSPGTPQQNVEAMNRWNPAAHSELKVYLHSSGSNFSRLAQAPDNAGVQALVQATLSKSTDLQISKQEAAKLPSGGGNAMAGPVAEFWSDVLSGRAAAGVFGQPPYDHTGKSIRPGDEINAMLRQQPKIQKQFAGLIGGKGEQFWELLEVENKGVLTLGASFNRQTSGGSYQLADVLYYASGGFYAAVTLYQLWPMEVDGRPSTLVWRGDMISSSEIGELRGVERLGAESAMMRDVSKAVRLFRRDTGATR